MTRPSYVCNACHGIGLDDASGFGNFTACEECKGEGSVQHCSDPPKQDKGALIGLAVAVLGVLSAFAIVYFRSN